MLKKIVYAIMGLAFISGTSMAQTKLVEKVTKKGDELIIPYEKYVLSNGLTLIIHEDKSDPVVHVDVTYHVGSAREEIGKSGFAHFFEHMMFQGSDNVADEEHFRIVTESGGTLNGTTNRDRTNYFETLPSNQLETGLWLEADRMGFLLDAVTQEKFEVQRETVKNERGQNYDNRPYGLSREYLAKNMYPYGHPYSWLTIGYIEDLNRVDVNDLKNFFLRWYGPNNAVLTVGGDVDSKEVVKLVEKYFGSIPRGPEVKNMPAMVPVIDKDRYVSYEDNYIRIPQLMMAWPTPEQYHEDEVALNVLAEILGQGKSSIFFQNFEKQQKALSSFAYNSTSELAGEFTVMVRPYPGLGLAEMEKIVRASLDELAEKGISEEDLLRYKATYEANLTNRLQSVSGKVSTLAAFATFASTPNYLPKALAAVQAVTADDVMRVFKKYVYNQPAVVLSVLPKGGDALKAGADNYEIDESAYKPGPDIYKGLSYNKAKDNFDRSKQPKAGPNPVIKVPAYWTENFGNGIKVIGTRYDELPIITLLISVKGGHLLSAKDPQKAGVAALMASMMNEGTANYSAEAFNDELKKLGSNISVNAGMEGLTVSVSSLMKNLDATLKLLEERMFRPAFEEADFVRLKKQQIEGIKNNSTQPGSIATSVYNKLLFGEDNIRAVSVSGTEQTVENISLDDVKKFYQSYFSPSVAELVVVGQIDRKDILAKLEFLKKWQGPKVEVPAFAATKAPSNTKIYLVDVPKSAQSEIRIGYPTAMMFDATGEYYKTGLMNYNLGGAFNSRINLNLREDKGWTYGARSFFSGSNLPGVFTASAGVKLTATDSAVFEFMREIKEFADAGISDKELAFLKSSIGQSDARKYETLFQKAGFLNQIITYNLDKDFTVKQSNILKNIKKEELNALAKKHLKTNNMYIVVVGDASQVKPGLERLGYEIVEVDKEGNLLSRAE